jgi:hypothetical protein
MKNITQNSMRRLEQLDPSCIGRRARFVYFQ